MTEEIIYSEEREKLDSLEDCPPGWYYENKLAREAGYKCIVDTYRGSEADGWCKFIKDDVWVWRPLSWGSKTWVRAILTPEMMFVGHEHFGKLEDALKGEQ